MLKKMSLRAKLLSLGISLTLVPLLILAVVVYTQSEKMMQIAKVESTKLANQDLDHIVRGIYDMCQTNQDLLEDEVAHMAKVGMDQISQRGEVCLAEDEDPIKWTAVNQYNKQTHDVSLPKLYVGDEWIQPNSDPNTKSPVVDEIRDLTGGSATIFQRMGDSWDMLRISTNIKDTNGSRAIGTFIPAVNPDGQENPVIAAVRQGQTFIGRALVLNVWYITAYAPIYDESKKNIIGMLYAGVEQEKAAALRQAILKTKVGKTGYVYVIDSQGRYIISKDGKRDGENIYDAKDANGDYFIQDAIAKAKKLGEGESCQIVYPWKNEGDATARNKIVQLMHFKQWDWIIGAGSYEDEFNEAANNIAEVGSKGNVILAGVCIVAALVASVVWFMMAKALAGKIMRIVTNLAAGAEQTSSAASQVSASSQSLAQGASEQAAAIEETTSSVEEMSSMTKQNAANANEAKSLAGSATANANKGAEAMQRMSKAIDDIKKSSDETAKIVKTIDEIAFQTNLLALNAAVEAARAGEAGKGFAVVAEEVRNLAQRSAEAAKNTANMIEESVKNAENGVAISKEVAESLREISEGNRKVNDLVAEIAAASNEQAQGIEQINTAVGQMDQVTQSSAATAEESASASEELSAQAEELNRMVQELRAVINGAGAKSGGELSFKAHAEPKKHVGTHTQKSTRSKAAKAATKAREVHAGKSTPEAVIPMDDDEGLAEF